MPHTFGDDERVAAKDDRDVMVPAGKPPAFVVVESQLVLEILVGPFNSPALHHLSHQLLLRLSPRLRAEEAVRRLGFVVAPFNQQPDRFALLDPMRALVCRDDAPKREPSREVLLGTLPPGASPKSTSCIDAVREVDDADDLVASTPELVEHHHDRSLIDGDRVVQAQLADALPKLPRRAVGLVCEHEPWGNPVLDGASKQLQRELRLGRELHVVRASETFSIRPSSLLLSFVSVAPEIRSEMTVQA